jgi:hypothetical protein
MAALGITRDNQQKEEAIRNAIEEMRDADPHLTFTLASNHLRRQKPHLFDFENPKPAKPQAKSL